MPQHATPQNVQALALICSDTAEALSTSTKSIFSQVFQITDQPVLDATFSSMASRLDNISTMADQFDSLQRSLELTLTSPPPTT